jgi:hypothetical protein
LSWRGKLRTRKGDKGMRQREIGVGCKCKVSFRKHGAELPAAYTVRHTRGVPLLFSKLCPSVPGHYKKKVVALERGPLSLVSTTEELLDRKVAAPV